MLYKVIAIGLILSFLMLIALEVTFLLIVTSNKKPTTIKATTRKITKKLKTRKRDKAYEDKLKKMNTIMKNIDNYDGSSLGQVEVDG